MKTLILTWLVYSCSIFVCNAQTINGIPIKELEAEYIQIVAKPESSKVNIKIELDYGQDRMPFSNKSHLIMDENNKSKTFKSMIEALNYLTQNGYSFVQAYTFSNEDGNILHYLLRKTDKSLSTIPETH